jgi:muramoyltetrapeptide carboxypeptidase LdcA involved in peptidoglycan recycling
MKYAGWFEHTNAVLMGRVLFESSDTGMTYEEALKKALPGIPVVYQADVGHTLPHMTLIMGSVMNLKYADHKGSISFQLR